MINHVFNEDCLEGMKRIPDKSVDMILCDLPYGTTACKWDVIIPFDKLWEQYERVIKDNGSIVLTASQPFTSALVMSNPKLFRYEWIWHKKQGCNFNQAPCMPLKIQENILVFSKATIAYNSKNKMQYFPQGVSDVKKLCKARGVASDHLPNRRAHSEFHQRGTNYPTDIITFAKEGKWMHPTQKPVALFEYLIKTYTLQSGQKHGHSVQVATVLDNCMGSGTTAIACINTGRNYIGFEKEEKYYNIIQDRIKNHVIQKELFAA
jgi:site-specific DNA-methyltransferase (adenine-specific)